MTEEMVGHHHQLDGHEFEQALGVGDGTGKPGMLHHLGNGCYTIQSTACVFS